MRRPGFRRCPTCDGECSVEVELEPGWLDTGTGGRWVARSKWRECPRCDGEGEIRVCMQCEEEMPQGDTAERCSPCVASDNEEAQGVQQ